MFELSKQFHFEAAHTLRREVEIEASRRIHGHSYRAVITLRGPIHPASGMVIDLGLFARALDETRAQLDHRFLDEVQDLGPATIENLSAWIWRNLEHKCPGLAQVAVHRDSQGDFCTYFGPETRS
jgi:6-pyruvoyltetrahydropterin/6-carboxytetrahydropterin synthase